MRDGGGGRRPLAGLHLLPHPPLRSFSYDPIMWGPHTFPDGVHTDNAPELFAHFHNDLHMRFGGIRKPRTYRCVWGGAEEDTRLVWRCGRHNFWPGTPPSSPSSQQRGTLQRFRLATARQIRSWRWRP